MLEQNMFEMETPNEHMNFSHYVAQMPLNLKLSSSSVLDCRQILPWQVNFKQSLLDFSQEHTLTIDGYL